MEMGLAESALSLLRLETASKPNSSFIAVSARFYSEKEVDALASAAIGLGKILKCEKALNFSSRGLKVYQDMDEMKIQLIDAIKVKQGCDSGLVSKVAYCI